MSDCQHERKRLMYVGMELEEWWCLDCYVKIRIWADAIVAPPGSQPEELQP